MDALELNERLLAVQEGTSTEDRFAALCLTELLREACQVERACGFLVAGDWKARVVDVAAVCGVGTDAAQLLWEWVCDIAGDYALEDVDPWGVAPR